MPAKDHALWDVVSDNPLRWWPSADRRRRNATARTAFLDGPEIAPEPDLVRATVIARRKPGPLMRMRVWWWPTLGWSLSMAVVAGLSMAFVLLSYRSGGKPSGFHLIPLGMMLYGLCFAATTIPLIRRSRAWRQTMGQRCPDCNYDLSASHPQPPLDPNTLGINLGPRHCPECGALWPLVPPPIPPEPTPPPLPAGRGTKNVRSKS